MWPLQSSLHEGMGKRNFLLWVSRILNRADRQLSGSEECKQGAPHTSLMESPSVGGLLGRGWGWARLGSRGLMGITSLEPISAERPFSNEKKMTGIIQVSRKVMEGMREDRVGGGGVRSSPKLGGRGMSPQQLYG